VTIRDDGDLTPAEWHGQGPERVRLVLPAAGRSSWNRDR